jgi:HAD superfamily hydrolase (TIGR01459 family)
VTQIISGLAAVSARYDALFVDLWGCVHNGVAPFPAAVAALQAYRRGGGAVVLVTNAPRPKGDVMRQLDRIGVARDAWDEIATSGDAAQYAAATGAVGRKVWHIGTDKDESFFAETAEDIPPVAVERVALEVAEGIICTGLFDDLTEVPEDYRARLMWAAQNRLPMLCANPDIVVDWGDRRLWCAGALAQMYEEMGGRALYFGKPHPPIYDLARRRLLALGRDVAEDRILCIGDGIGTDVAGAGGEGLDCLFITGGLAADQFGADPANPDPAMLKAWLEVRQAAPRWAIGHLR